LVKGEAAEVCYGKRIGRVILFQIHCSVNQSLEKSVALREKPVQVGFFDDATHFTF
jgi:hypothetical protein